jgi:hypothetical protein
MNTMRQVLADWGDGAAMGFWLLAAWQRKVLASTDHGSRTHFATPQTP